jgi:Flp pilus assembly protein TadB
MLFWLIVLGVIVVLAALAWWTSGRTRRGGVDSDKMRRSTLDSQNDVSIRAGRPGPGPGPIGPVI